MRDRLERKEPTAHPLIALYTDPQDILDDGISSRNEKRAVLASWASDVRALTNEPALRRLDNGSIVHIDDVLDALKKLYEIDEETITDEQTLPFNLRHWWRDHHRRDDDDDDPPLSPAAIDLPWPLPVAGGAAALVAT